MNTTHQATKHAPKSGLIVLSGGMDSVTLLYEYQESIALALSFNYGSKHNAQEIAYAREHCQALGIEHIVIDLDFMNAYFRSDLLLSGGGYTYGSLQCREYGKHSRPLPQWHYAKHCCRTCREP